ncbi:MAG: hypothetical protein COU27_00840 [Candidatus Levybacteria bacterium CG10_big_fil_rev_8_21_14_0_10_36_7]|nr:MAG: hypothetical protein COU27_00840 [Candidatus Levybacteria bacterium CG10_big_fil_rev_8_21_14_0_10_36_7]
MAKNNVLLRKYTLLFGDLVLMYFSLFITLYIRYYNSPLQATYQEHLLPFSIVYLAFLIIFFINELYQFEFVKSKINLLSRIIVSLSIGGLLATAFFYFGYNHFFSIRPQRVLFINLFVILLFIYVWRIVFFRYAKSQKFSNNLLVVGYNPLTEEIIKNVLKSPQLGFRVSALLRIQQEPTEEIHSDITIYDGIENLKKACEKENIHTVVSKINPRENKQLLSALYESLSLRLRYFDASNFYERISGKIPVSTIEHIWFLENLSEQSKAGYEIMKRIFDIIVSVILLVMTLPFLPIIMLAVRLDSAGEIIFKQIRTGKNGKKFNAMKFRSMTVEAEKNGPQWAIKNDPRITRVGRIMRKTRIDEIPQLINVLKGEMSIIGPRPERPEFIETLSQEIPFYKERLLVKPGLTGWAQVMGPAYGGSIKETMQKLQYDLFYIKNRSIALDLSILLKTVKTVLLHKGQ